MSVLELVERKVWQPSRFGSFPFVGREREVESTKWAFCDEPLKGTLVSKHD